MGDQVPTGPICIALNRAVTPRAVSICFIPSDSPQSVGRCDTQQGWGAYCSHQANEDIAICFSFYSGPWTSWASFLMRSMDLINSLEPSCTWETWNSNRNPEKSKWKQMAQKVRIAFRPWHIFCSDPWPQLCSLFLAVTSPLGFWKHWNWSAISVNCVFSKLFSLPPFWCIIPVSQNEKHSLIIDNASEFAKLGYYKTNQEKALQSAHSLLRKTEKGTNYWKMY